MDVFENHEKTQRVMEALKGKHEKRLDIGKHVSDYAGRCLRKAYFDITNPEPVDDALILHFLRGKALHDMLALGEPKVLECDGILGHTDDSFFGSDAEWKTTNYSSGNMNWLREDKWSGLPGSYLAQIMCYMHMIGTTTFTLGLMHMQGDYKNRLPVIKIYDLVATKEELNLHWAFILDRKDRLEYAVDEGIPPSVATRWFKSECDNCPYFTRCRSELLDEGT